MMPEAYTAEKEVSVLLIRIFTYVGFGRRLDGNGQMKTAKRGT
jgi:hypothetical protein